MMDWILYVCVYCAFFGFSLYGLSCIDFPKFCKVRQPQKVQLLLFLLALSMAWMCTEAVLTLTIRKGMAF